MYKLFFLGLLCLTAGLTAEYKGRLDVGPAYASIDMLTSGKTERTYNLPAVKADATITIYEAFCIKPSYLYANGDANLNSGSIGLGFCIPIICDLYMTPSYGWTETRFKSKIEKFVSRGQYIALDASWTFLEKWRLYGMAQWCWSKVRTKLGPFTFKNHCKGPNYAVCLERDLNEHFSVSLAAGYNTSLSKEKHGLRGKGVKLGLAYWW